MSQKNSIITIEQREHFVPGPEQNDYNYTVLKLQNRTSPKIGEVLTEKQVRMLMSDRLTTIKIVGQQL